MTPAAEQHHTTTITQPLPQHPYRYLLNVQESLSAAVGRSKDEVAEERLLVEELRTNERVQDRKCRSLQKQCRQFQSTLQAASRMLANVGVDTTALRRMSEEAFADPVGTSSE